MASLPTTITLDVQPDQLRKIALGSLAQAFGKAKPSIEAKVAQLVENAIVSSPEAADLQGGRLQGELGVLRPSDAIRAIIATLQQSMQVSFADHMLTVSLVKSDLQDVLRLGEATFRSEPSGQNVPWLEWLLTAGDQIVVLTHHYLPFGGKTPGDIRLRSRTGLGLMAPYGKFGIGAWQVPPEFAGVPGDHWLTRALAVVLPQIADVALQEMVRAAP